MIIPPFNFFSKNSEFVGVDRIEELLTGAELTAYQNASSNNFVSVSKATWDTLRTTLSLNSLGMNNSNFESRVSTAGSIVSSNLVLPQGAYLIGAFGETWNQSNATAKFNYTTTNPSGLGTADTRQTFDMANISLNPLTARMYYIRKKPTITEGAPATSDLYLGIESSQSLATFNTSDAGYNTYYRNVTTGVWVSAGGQAVKMWFLYSMTNLYNN